MRDSAHQPIAVAVPPSETYQRILTALEACSLAQIGPARPEVLAVPITDDAGTVAGGLWGSTLFGWLYIQLLVVPEDLRGQGVGRGIVALAEAEARRRGCVGAYVQTFSFQAGGFYAKLGYTSYGVLHDYPPGHDLLHFCKRFHPSAV